MIRGMPTLSNRVLAPIPDNCRICGEPIAPADRITSRRARTWCIPPPFRYSTPTAVLHADPPGTTASDLHRINDVNLQVTSPTGTIYHGNVGLDAGTGDRVRDEVVRRMIEMLLHNHRVA